MATSKSVTKSKSTAVAVASFSDDLAALKTRLAAPSGDKVKYDKQKFKLPNGDSLDFLAVVIVDFIYMNRFYSSGYEKDSIIPPDCFALNPLDKDLEPSKNSIEVQNDKCASCAQNQYGSKGKGKACSNRMLMACLPTNADAETPFVILDVPPTSLKNFQQYANSVARGLGRPPFGVVTHVEFDTTSDYAKLIFNEPQALDDAEFIGMVRGRIEEARERLLTEPDYSAMEAANDAPKVKSKLKAPVRRRA